MRLDEASGPRPVLRRLFRWMNRSVMLPAFRLDLAPWMVNPVTGYFMVLRTTGRRSGQVREAPVNYAILDGCIYCLAGWGRQTHWFANLLADPQVTVRLPSGMVLGEAEEVTDVAEAQRAIVRVARNAGFALLFDGLNPLTASDQDILERHSWMPVVRIRPVGLLGGPHDPDGYGWIGPVVAGGAWVIARRLRRRNRDKTWGT